MHQNAFFFSTKNLRTWNRYFNICYVCSKQQFFSRSWSVAFTQDAQFSHSTHRVVPCVAFHFFETLRKRTSEWEWSFKCKREGNKEWMVWKFLISVVNVATRKRKVYFNWNIIKNFSVLDSACVFRSSTTVNIDILNGIPYDVISERNGELYRWCSRCRNGSLALCFSNEIVERSAMEVHGHIITL